MENVGIYIHVPFCVKKCRYCDFYSITDLTLRQRYAEAAIEEMAMIDLPGITADTLYFGGGTPPVLGTARIEMMLLAAVDRFGLDRESEITIEVNPGTVDAAAMADYRRMGINRINIGVQSFDDACLRFLGRLHTARESVQAIESAVAAGFANIGIDLMFGLQIQRMAHWEADLDRAVDLALPHLSCYGLGVEPGTPLAADVTGGRVADVDPDRVADMFMTAQAMLTAAGYRQYEVSNYALSPAHRSRHNCKYWQGAPYIGIGPGAHSYLPPKRWWHHRDLHRYVADVRGGKRPVEGEEVLSRRQQIIEAVYLGLRQSDGIDIDDFNRRHEMDFRRRFDAVITAADLDGYIRCDDHRCALTPDGLRFADGIAGRLVDQLMSS